MRHKIIKTIKFSLGAVTLCAILGNSGCLVDTGSDVAEPKKIDQKFLRIYKAGDEIRYDARIDVHTGTIVTKWELPGVIPDGNPLEPNNQEIPGLLKETTTLEYDSLDQPITVVRYITQDSDPTSATYGAITVHMFTSQSANQYDYVNDSASMANPPVPAVIQPSPFALDDNFQPVSGQSDQMINYYVLPCDSSNNTCSSGANQYLSETLTLSQMIKENLETTVDTFETIKVPYDGVINDQNANDPNIRLDIRAFCGVANDTNISFSGSRWYYPKIGVVRYEMHCSSSSGDQQIAAATVSSVKFQY